VVPRLRLERVVGPRVGLGERRRHVAVAGPHGVLSWYVLSPCLIVSIDRN
jgi:hypothetical protein